MCTQNNKAFLMSTCCLHATSTDLSCFPFAPVHHGELIKPHCCLLRSSEFWVRVPGCMWLCVRSLHPLCSFQVLPRDMQSGEVWMWPCEWLGTCLLQAGTDSRTHRDVNKFQRLLGKVTAAVSGDNIGSVFKSVSADSLILQVFCLVPAATTSSVF